MPSRPVTMWMTLCQPVDVEDPEHGLADRLVAGERRLVEEADDAGGDEHDADDHGVEAGG
jgi:hypothetical protein